MKSFIAKFHFACRRALAALNGNASRALLASLLLFTPFFGRAEATLDSLNQSVDDIADLLASDLLGWYDDYFEEVCIRLDEAYAVVNKIHNEDLNQVKSTLGTLRTTLLSVSESLNQLKTKIDSWDDVKDVSIPTLLNDLNACKMDVNNIFNLLNNNLGDLKIAIQDVSYWVEAVVDTQRDANMELRDIHALIRDDVIVRLDFIYDQLGWLIQSFDDFKTLFDSYSQNVISALREIIDLLNGEGHIEVNLSVDNINAIISALGASVSGWGPIDVEFPEGISLDDIIEYLRKIHTLIDRHFKLQTPFFDLFNASSNIYFKGYSYLNGPKLSATKTSLSFSDFTPQNVNVSTITFFDSVKRLYEMEVDYYQSFETLLHNIQFSLTPTNAPDISTAKSKIEGASDSVDSVSSSLHFDLPSFTKTFPTSNPFSPLQSGFSLPQNLTFDLAPNGVFGFSVSPVVINVSSVASYLSPIRYVCKTIYWGLSLLLFLLLARWSVRGVVYLVGHVKDFKF